MSLNSLGATNGGHASNRMTHSLSTPSGVDGSTSTSHHSRGGKKLAVRVQMLDDSMTMFQVQVRTGRLTANTVLKFTALVKCTEGT